MGKSNGAGHRMKVITNAPAFPTMVRYGNGAFSEVAGSVAGSPAPIVVGVWNADDTDGNTAIFIPEEDEVKYIFSGESIWRDVCTGQEFQVDAGSILWLPKDCQVIRVQSKNLSAFYVEKAFREPTTLIEPTARWAANLGEFYSQKLAEYTQRNQESRRQLDEAVQHLPGGNTRTVLHYDPFPMVLVSGRDCYVTSKDGHEYLDCVSEYSAALFGHSHPVITEAVRKATSNGINLGGPGLYEVELARLIKNRFRSIEKLRFCNSGSEANTMALAVATIFTKKRKILAFENSYHGGTIGFTSTPNPTNIPHDFVVSRFNDIEYTKGFLSEDIAAIIVEPMQGAGGLIPATREFLQFLRDSATRIGALLIFDEIVTSRLHINGLQGYHNVYPDLTTLGKYIGGGSSFGAFGGRSDIMETLDPRKGVAHSGTYNNNVYSMAAGIAGCKILTEEKIAGLNALGDKLRNGINVITKKYKMQHMQATGFGSMVGIRITGPSAVLLKDALFFHFLSAGVYVGKRGFMALNLLHEDKHIVLVLDAFSRFMEEVFGDYKWF